MRVAVNQKNKKFLKEREHNLTHVMAVSTKIRNRKVFSTVLSSGNKKAFLQ